MIGKTYWQRRNCYPRDGETWEEFYARTAPKPPPTQEQPQ